MCENGEIYTAGKKSTLPPAVTEGTNLTSIEWRVIKQGGIFGLEGQCMPGYRDGDIGDNLLSRGGP